MPCNWVSLLPPDWLAQTALYLTSDPDVQVVGANFSIFIPDEKTGVTAVYVGTSVQLVPPLHVKYIFRSVPIEAVPALSLYKATPETDVCAEVGTFAVPINVPVALTLPFGVKVVPSG